MFIHKNSSETFYILKKMRWFNWQFYISSEIHKTCHTKAPNYHELQLIAVTFPIVDFGRFSTPFPPTKNLLFLTITLANNTRVSGQSATCRKTLRGAIKHFSPTLLENAMLQLARAARRCRRSFVYPNAILFKCVPSSPVRL